MTLISKTLINLEKLESPITGVVSLNQKITHNLSHFIEGVLQLLHDGHALVVQDLENFQGRKITFNSDCIIYEQDIDIIGCEPNSLDYLFIEDAILSYMSNKKVIPNKYSEIYKGIYEEFMSTFHGNYKFSFKILNICDVKYSCYSITRYRRNENY